MVAFAGTKICGRFATRGHRADTARTPGRETGMRKAPRGGAAGPFARQHRRQGTAGAWRAAQGGAPLPAGGGPPGPPRACVGSAGRPRASPEPTVLLGDRAAVPCRPVTCPGRGPTTYGTTRTSHRPSEPRVVLSGPPLAGTDTGTNEAPRAPVTRRTGESGPELRC